MKLKYNKSVQTMVIAVFLALIIPVLYVVLFVFKANKEINDKAPKVLQGYNSQKECEQATGSDCNPLKTIQEDQYWVANH